MDVYEAIFFLTRRDYDESGENELPDRKQHLEQALKVIDNAIGQKKREIESLETLQEGIQKRLPKAI